MPVTLKLLSLPGMSISMIELLSFTDLTAPKRIVPCDHADHRHPQLYIGSTPASPTAGLVRKYRRAGTQNDRLGEGFSTVRSTCPQHVYTPGSFTLNFMSLPGISISMIELLSFTDLTSPNRIVPCDFSGPAFASPRVPIASLQASKGANGRQQDARHRRCQSDGQLKTGVSDRSRFQWPSCCDIPTPWRSPSRAPEKKRRSACFSYHQSQPSLRTMYRGIHDLMRPCDSLLSMPSRPGKLCFSSSSALACSAAA